jgi:hypothetical protein
MPTLFVADNKNVKPDDQVLVLEFGCSYLNFNLLDFRVIIVRFYFSMSQT